MSKAYLIAHITIHDSAAYQEYAAQATVAQQKYGAHVLARGGRSIQLEGDHRPRNVILEFESYDAALKYYHSPEYQAARAHRKDGSEGEFLIVEGV